jgi:hypothetical protein
MARVSVTLLNACWQRTPKIPLRKVNPEGTCVLRASPILAVITGPAWEKNNMEVHLEMPLQISSSVGQSAIDRLQTILEWFAVILFIFSALFLYRWRLRADIYFTRRLRQLRVDEYVLHACQTELVERTLDRLNATAEQAGRPRVPTAAVKRALDDVLLIVVAWVREGPEAIQDTSLEYVEDILWEFQVPSRVGTGVNARTVSEDELKALVLVWVIGATVMISCNVGMYVLLTDGLIGPAGFLFVGLILFFDVSIGSWGLWTAIKRVMR